MPIYDYHCSRCDKEFELLVLKSTIPACPDCGSEELEKRLSIPAAPARTPGILAQARSQAAKEGHFSNYSKKESAKIKT